MERVSQNILARVPKKGLSGGSNQDEERKKIRNSNSAISTDNCDGFEEGLGSPECKEIFLIVLRICRKTELKFTTWNIIGEISRLKMNSN